MPIQHLDRILKEIENLDFSQLQNISSKIKTFSDRQTQQENALETFLDEQKLRTDKTLKAIDKTHKSISKEQEKHINDFFEKQRKENNHLLNNYIAEKNATISTRLEELTHLKKKIDMVDTTITQVQEYMQKSEDNLELKFTQFTQKQEEWKQNFNAMWENSNKMRENSQKLQEKENTAIHQSIENLNKQIQKELEQHNDLLHIKINDLSETLSTELLNHASTLSSQKKRLIILGIIAFGLSIGILFIFFYLFYK